MPAQTPTCFVTFWKLRSRLKPGLRQILDDIALISPDHKLSDRNIDFYQFSRGVLHNSDYVIEFGLDPLILVREMRRIWYQHPEPRDKDLYVGLRVVFYTVQDAEVRVARLKQMEGDRIVEWR
jgi:hypothetical protein